MKHSLIALKETFDAHFSLIVEELITPYPKEYHYIKDFILQGGKQVRPLLFLEACALWGKEIDTPTLDIASGIELIHNFFLIHDDIMDNDEMRRDQPTLHNYFSKNRSEVAGRALALVFGDLIYTEALSLLCRGSAQHSSQIIQQTALKVCSDTANGQILEFASDTIPSKDSLLEFYKKKTAEYSIFFPLIIAAYHSEVIDKEVSLTDLKILSDNLGIAYQLYDDVSEIVGAKKRMEHSERCGDIMRAKMTPIMVEMLPLFSPALQARVTQAYISQTLISEEDEREILQHIQDSKMLDTAQGWINLYLTEAESILPEVGLMGSELIQKLLTTYKHVPSTHS